MSVRGLDVVDTVVQGFLDVEEGVNTIQFSGTYSHIDESFVDILCSVLPSDFISGFAIKEEDGSRFFFELSGSTIRSGSGLDELDDSEPSYDETDVSGFERYRDQENWEEAAEYLDSICRDLSKGMQLEIRGDISKELIESAISDQYSDALSSLETNITFWRSWDAFDQWLNGKNPNRVVEAIFGLNRMPIFVIKEEVETTVDGIVASAVADLTDLDISSLKEAHDEYSDQQEIVRTVIDWTNGLAPIHPSPINTLKTNYDLPNLNSLFVYAVLGLFSQSVQRDAEGAIIFRIENNPELAARIECSEFNSGFTDGIITGMDSLYKEFYPQSQEEAFRHLWQRAIAESIADADTSQDPLSEIVSSEGEIIDTVKNLKKEVIKENFEGLSDALEETQSLMANITSRLSDAATENSRRIQSLGFTLLGAIIANIFLVLRWSENKLVLPFTIFVFIIVLVFYLPLIQGQIDDLDTVITESQEDFELYRDRIRQFNKDLFEFSDLEERVSRYQTLAKTQRDRAQKWMEVTFYALIGIWMALASISAIMYPLVSLHTLSIAVSTIVFILLVYPHEYSPRDNGYFNSVPLYGAIGLGIILIIVSCWIGSHPDAVGWFENLPRFSDN